MRQAHKVSRKQQRHGKNVSCGARQKSQKEQHHSQRQLQLQRNITQHVRTFESSQATVDLTSRKLTFLADSAGSARRAGVGSYALAMAVICTASERTVVFGSRLAWPVCVRQQKREVMLEGHISGLFDILRLPSCLDSALQPQL